MKYEESNVTYTWFLRYNNYFWISFLQVFRHFMLASVNMIDFSVMSHQETVSKSEYDQMVKRHEEDIIYLQEEYE